jgi:NAD(P)-dependent dehydrogenase (short-subunit alcohol dehydrogenase family)
MLASPDPTLPPTLLPLLTGKRVLVLGSGSGLGRAVALAAEAAGAEVLGLDDRKSFDGVSALYRADLTDPAALEAAVAALPDGIDALALLPDPGEGGPETVLARALLAPRHLAEALAPRLAANASIVARAAPPGAGWAAALSETRAAMALRWDDLPGFVARWGLNAEPARALRTAGWGMLAWVMAQRLRGAGRSLRLNAITPAAPDGRLPPAAVAASGQDAAAGTAQAAAAALFLMSDLARGLTGANIAADGGLSARITSSLDGL